MASSTRVLDVLSSPTEIIQGEYKPSNDEISKSDIELNSVSFAYTGRENVFENLDLTIKSGETTGIVGSTGSGKTTLIRLYYDSQNQTKVRLNG